MTSVPLQATGQAYSETTNIYNNACLELTDNNLKLFSTSEDNTITVIFDTPLSLIENISGFGATLRFVIEGKDCGFIFPTRFGYRLPHPSTLTYIEVEKDSGIDKWVDIFKAKGVNVTFKKTSTMNRIGFAIALFIVLVVVGIAVYKAR